jgi:hypothetical protein
MATTQNIAAELLGQLRRDREKIATELPELIERGQRLYEAAAENSLCGHLRRAIHRSVLDLDLRPPTSVFRNRSFVKRSKCPGFPSSSLYSQPVSYSMYIKPRLGSTHRSRDGRAPARGQFAPDEPRLVADPLRNRSGPGIGGSVRWPH